MRDDQRFQDLVRRAAPLTYATRCRLVADEVRRQHSASNLPTAAQAWLDEQLATLSAIRGTMAEVALRRASAGGANGARMTEIRAWAFGQLRPTDLDAWRTGADSRSIWSLLMAPVPVDDEQVQWLAQSTGVDPVGLRALASLDVDQAS